MSSGSFAFTAAYSYVGDSAVYMPNGSDGQCRFRDFEHECVKEACPGQVTPIPRPHTDCTDTSGMLMLRSSRDPGFQEYGKPHPQPCKLTYKPLAQPPAWP